MARNILEDVEEMEVLELSITKTFSWKIKTPQKICHIIWQLIIEYVVLTRNLTCHVITIAQDVENQKKL